MSRILLIIDMQRFVEDRICKGVNYYPHDAINNMEYVLKKFRKNKWLVAHVIHQSEGEDSLLNQYSPYYPVITGFENDTDEPVFIKKTSSAFASTDLKKYLDDNAISEVVVIGAVAGFCVNSTVRHGADLGMRMTVVKDAVISFDLSGGRREEKNIHDVTMNLLKADFARITSSNEF
ncbi:isochorismatase family protein [Edaphovirga cremea]|uniref:isochorismatase family protein n=1 Tax=Edaphovirga cremea TaxID=2267246 RepID=UPI003989BCC6